MPLGASAACRVRVAFYAAVVNKYRFDKGLVENPSHPA